jgi:hypothetical protein
MPRILTVDPGQATEITKDILDHAAQQHGGVIPGIYLILLVDLKLAQHLGEIYQHLNFRSDSPLTRLQREMIGTVVNGMIGGAP